MKFCTAAGLLVGAVVLHFVAVATGIYDVQIAQGLVWFDNVLHAMAGIAFALIGLFILEKIRPETSIILQATIVLFFVLAMAITWELLELAFYLYFKSHALGLKVYSPTLAEAVFDSASNFLGACGYLLWVLKGRILNFRFK